MSRIREQPRDPEPGLILSQWLPWLAALWAGVYWLSFFSQEMPNSGYFRVDVVFQLPEIFWGLVFPEPRPDVPSGWRYLPQRFDLLLCGAFILLAALCAGRLLLRGLGLLDLLDQPTRTALAGGAGMSLVSLFTLVCGVTGMLNRGLFISAFIGLMGMETGACWWSKRRAGGQSGIALPVGSAAQRQKLERSDADCPQWLKWTCGAVCVPFLICMLLGAMLPSTDFDVKEYHLQGPKEFFLDGRVGFLPHNVYTSFPFLTEMLSLAGMVVRGDWYRGALVGKVVLMAFAPLTALGVFAVARRIAGVAAGWLGAAVYLSTPWTYRISIIAYTEGALCSYVILTLLGFLVSYSLLSACHGSVSRAGEHVSQGGRLRPLNVLFLTGLLAGSAAATKYPGLVLVVIPFALAVVGLLMRGGHGSVSRVTAHDSPSQDGAHGSQSRGTLIRGLAVYGVGVLIAFGPWITKNLVETGNPVYPLMYSVFGGVDWDDELNEKWKRGHSPPVDVLRDPRRWPGDLRQSFIDVALKNDWQSPLLFGLAPLAFLSRRQRRRVWLVAGYAAWILGVWYVLTHRIDRFWVPVVPVLAVLAGVGVVAWRGRMDELRRGGEGKKGRRGDKETGRRGDGEAVLAALLPLAVWGLVGFAVIYNLGFIVTPLAGFNAYLLDHDAARRLTLREGGTMTDTIALIERLKLPEGSKVLFVGEAQVFDATFPHLYNTVFDHSLLEQMTSTKHGPGDWELHTPNAIRDNFRVAGVTHVFVNWNEILRYRTTYGYTDFVSPGRLRELTELGVLTPVPLFRETSLRLWDGLDPSWQQQVSHWGSELRQRHLGHDVLLQYQLFEVHPDKESS